VRVYYNEIDPAACEWLGELQNDGLIPEGHVDRRSITEVKPEELAGYWQAHFFAGIGGWAEALRLAGVPDLPCWTGSCPCQPFSPAGQRKGLKDERHLWPAWFGLVEKRRPPIIIGEQVAPAIAHGWLDLVFGDLKGIGYACTAAVFPACCVGAPHKRERLFWGAILLGHADIQRPQRSLPARGGERAGGRPFAGFEGAGFVHFSSDDLDSHS
jgi:DNA (cytosine-5)-methyltransferase 1